MQLVKPRCKPVRGGWVVYGLGITKFSWVSIDRALSLWQSVALMTVLKGTGQ